ncbi:phytochrome-like protein [Mycena rebaudengoi]|nr:phytochrome-like protein [Mycena rebaudengoi]
MPLGPFLTTTRLRHVQDEHGHHVVVGRDGVLARCEDEPIRTPGAIQGFGVLIVVDEVNDALVVRQVSENAEHLLGLPPRYLFSLECFTDALPQAQGDALWEKIEYMSAPDDSDGPHVFLLSGWGAPTDWESAAPDPDRADDQGTRHTWSCWCAVHRAWPSANPEVDSSPGATGRGMIAMEFELKHDIVHLLYPVDDAGPLQPASGSALDSAHSTVEEITESTTSGSKPLPALERLNLRGLASNKRPAVSSDAQPPSSSSTSNARRSRRRRPAGGGGDDLEQVDLVAVLAQMEEQLGATSDLDTFLQVVVGVVKDLTCFHRVMIYQFDTAWNGMITTELVDLSKTQSLYKGLRFPATDIPLQARELYALNKVRLLYDRSQPTARIVVREEKDLMRPLDMSHCYLRAISPIHIKYLENMGVRATMSVSIMAFGTLWGLVMCHSYGSTGMRVSFPVRHMLRLLSQSLSRNVERLIYAQHIKSRRISKYILNHVGDILDLFDADLGVLVIGESAKALGSIEHTKDVRTVAQYLRLKQFAAIQVSQELKADYQDLNLPSSLEAVAGMLHVPLSREGNDFICFMRRGELTSVRWAGRPTKNAHTGEISLQPRKSFDIWSEMVQGKCRAWTVEQQEAAVVLALVYGTFIEVWRQKERALQMTRLSRMLLANASHEEMALDGPLDEQTRDNLTKSVSAANSLLFAINDLLELSCLESGDEESSDEPFNLREMLHEATQICEQGAQQCGILFRRDLEQSPTAVVGNAKKIRMVVENLAANSLKYTSEGFITIGCSTVREPETFLNTGRIAVEIVVEDSGCGIAPEMLEGIFRDSEAEPTETVRNADGRIGLGLAVVARIVEQLGGHLRVESKIGEGTRFSLLIALGCEPRGNSPPPESTPLLLTPRAQALTEDSVYESFESGPVLVRKRILQQNLHLGKNKEGILSSTHFPLTTPQDEKISPVINPHFSTSSGAFKPLFPLSSVDRNVIEDPARKSDSELMVIAKLLPPSILQGDRDSSKLRVLIVEDELINRTMLAKRLRLDGHTVVTTTNGQEALDKVMCDRAYDVILMDLQMPILDGYQATARIRALEKSTPMLIGSQLSHRLNGGHIPIFAVSASLQERRRQELVDLGVDGWILKPINFKRLRIILEGVIDSVQRGLDVYYLGCNWEAGGWLVDQPAVVP